MIHARLRTICTGVQCRHGDIARVVVMPLEDPMSVLARRLLRMRRILRLGMLMGVDEQAAGVAAGMHPRAPVAHRLQCHQDNWAFPPSLRRRTSARRGPGRRLVPVQRSQDLQQCPRTSVDGERHGQQDQQQAARRIPA